LTPYKSQFHLPIFSCCGSSRPHCGGFSGGFELHDSTSDLRATARQQKTLTKNEADISEFKTAKNIPADEGRKKKSGLNKPTTAKLAEKAGRKKWLRFAVSRNLRGPLRLLIGVKSFF
jgi:hypothetical protein